jgi:PAS domain S-box-containing protein
LYDKQAILIVDEKQENHSSVEHILKKIPCKIIRVENSREALLASYQHDFSLAVLDVREPEGNRYGLAEFLRSEEKTKGLPIIIISDIQADDDILFNGYDRGPVDFLARPYHPDILLGKAKLFLRMDAQNKQLAYFQSRLNQADDFLQFNLQERTAELEETIEALRSEIMKRKYAEKDMLRAKKEWQEIFEAIGHMTMIVDKDYTIIAANRATQEHTGLSLENILGRKCYDIFHHSMQPTEACPAIQVHLESDMQVRISEVEIRGKTYIISCTPVYDEAGRLDKIIHIATDISRQKQLKKELIQAHKMEAIGSLAGGIAHDFNNILSAVLGYTELSLGSVEKGSELEEDLLQVHAAGIRARDLVKQILNFARKSDERPKPVRIDLIAKEAAKFLRSTLPSTIEIAQVIKSTSYVMANPIKIHQLMMNLCTNAAHAMDESGVLGISLKDVVVGKEDLSPEKNLRPGEYQQLEISDTGSGIPVDIIDKIFLPYFTTKGIHEGTGIGLAMVQSIVEECGGDISVASEPGHGAVFTVLLPKADVKEDNNNLDDFRLLPSGKESIMIVDDEPAICKLVSRILQGSGYKVTFEANSEKAYALFAAQPEAFDLVITDLTMPKMPGDILTQKIKSIRKDIPVIIATGYSKRISEQQAAALGVNNLIIKPYEKAMLLKTVRDTLDGMKTDIE